VSPAQVIAQLKALREPRMRSLALVQGFGEGEADAWVDAIAETIIRSHEQDDADAKGALESIRQAAADPAMPYETRQRLYAAAVLRGQHSIGRLFYAASPNAVASHQLEKQLAPERPLKPNGRPLTLGERKSLARTHDRQQLLMLLRDPHPAVVAILLDNPHLTEAEVVRVAAMRPAVPESLAHIAHHAKWSVRHAVKRALVLNPATPLADAMRLATTLRAAELAELAVDPSLPEALRTHAAEIAGPSR
jgi:uncharacterized protein (UPF0147 family)